MRQEQRVCMDAMRKEERVYMAQNTIIILSVFLSSYYLLETSSDESYDSRRRQILTKPVKSTNKSSTFPAKHKSYYEETPLKQPHQDAIK